MSALNLLTPENQTIGAAPFVPASFTENVSASFGDAMFRSRFNAAPFFVDRSGFTERDSLISERFNVDNPFDLIDTTEIDERFSNPTIQGRVAALNEKQGLLDTHIKEQRRINPDQWQGIKTKQEIEEFTKDVARQARSELEETQSRSGPVTGFTGGLVGGVLGAFTDPINIATLPLGAGAGMGILRAMGAEAIVNMAIEVAETPDVAKWQKELGFKYGVGEASADILLAGVGGAAFTGIIRASGAGLRAAGSKSMKVLDNIANKAPVTSEQRDAFNYQSRVAHIDETVPVNRGLDREDIRIQREAVAETQDAVLNYRQADLSKAQDRFDLPELEPPPVPERLISQARDIKSQLTAIPDVDLSKPRELKKILGRTPESLTQFIKRTGGVQDPGGELREIGITLPGLIRKGKAKEGTAQGVIQIDNQIDSVRSRAFEEGFFPEARSADDVSNDDLFDAIRNDLEGRKVFKSSDLEEVSEATGGQGFVESFDREGITFDMSEEEIARVLQRIEEDLVFTDDILNNPNALNDMDASVADMSDPQVHNSFEADFARLLKDEPDFRIDIDGEERTLRQVSDTLEEQKNILNAVRTCAIG